MLGEQMMNEETIQLEEAKMVAEQEAWERLHEAIFKGLFSQNRKAKSTNLRNVFPVLLLALRKSL